MLLIDRIFNLTSLIIINLLIIISAEFIGDGKYFIETGLINIVAIFFIALIIARIFYRHYTHDPIFERFVYGVLIASLIFALSHIFEYTSVHIYNISEYATSLNAVNFYLSGFIVIAIGAELFLKIFFHRSLYVVAMLFVALFSLLTTSVISFFNPGLISLEITRPEPYLYAILTIACAFIGISTVLKMKSLVPASSGFINYLLASLSLILISTIPYIFYEFIEETFGHLLGSYQIIYVGHFIFFAALSLLFLSFAKLNWGGLYAETRSLVENNNK